MSNSLKSRTTGSGAQAIGNTTLAARVLPRQDAGIEWPTWTLVVVIYGVWLTLIFAHRSLPAWVSYPALVLVVAWYMSLQHELLHGHPTRNKAFNRLLGIFPMSAWYPYDIYRDSHLTHHRDEWLTAPGVDPECNYVLPQDYARMNALQRGIRWSLRTALGRFLLGPGVTICEVWVDIFTGPRKRGMACVRSWALHLALLVAMLWWVVATAGIHPLAYLFCVAYPALGLAMMRSFFEHRPSALPAHRTVINDAAWPWGLLYLNNNYHALHHQQAGLAWYRIPAAYRADHHGLRVRNNGFYLAGYCRLLWKHALKPIDSPVHPGFEP